MNLRAKCAVSFEDAEIAVGMHVMRTCVLEEEVVEIQKLQDKVLQRGYQGLSSVCQLVCILSIVGFLYCVDRLTDDRLGRFDRQMPGFETRGDEVSVVVQVGFVDDIAKARCEQRLHAEYPRCQQPFRLCSIDLKFC